MNDLETRKTLARGAFAEMTELDPFALRVLAQGLALAEPPLCELAQPLAYFVTALEHGDAPGALAVLRMARALRVLAAHPDCPDLLDRLEALDGPPWAPIREALLTLTTERKLTQ